MTYSESNKIKYNTKDKWNKIQNKKWRKEKYKIKSNHGMNKICISQKGGRRPGGRRPPFCERGGGCRHAYFVHFLFLICYFSFLHFLFCILFHLSFVLYFILFDSLYVILLFISPFYMFIKKNLRLRLSLRRQKFN